MVDTPLYKRISQITPSAAKGSAQTALNAFSNTAYQSAFQIAAKALQEQDQTLLHEERKVFDTQAKTSIYNALANGQTQFAEQMRNEAYDYLRTGSPGLKISDQRREYDAQEIVKFYNQAIVETKFNALASQNPAQAAQYLRQRLNAPQTLENIEIDNRLITQYNHYKTILGDQLNVEEILAQRGNAVYLAGKSQKELDAALEVASEQRAQRLGVPNDLGNKVAASLEFRTEFNSLVKGVENAIQFGDVNSGPHAMLVAGRSISAGSPAFVSMGSDARAKAIAYAASVDAGSDPIEAFQNINGLFSNFGPQEREGIDFTFSEETKSSGSFDLKTLDGATRNVAKALGVPTKLLRDNPAIVSQFASLFNNNRYYTRSIDTAKTDTANRMNAVVGVTQINGYKEADFHPIEKYLPDISGITQVVRDQYVQEAQKAFKSQKQYYDSAKADPTAFYYEFEGLGSNPTPSQIHKHINGLFGPKEIPVRRIYRNGEVQTGLLVIQPTNRSLRTSANPEYVVGISINGLSTGLRNDQGQPLRYTPQLDKVSHPELYSDEVQSFLSEVQSIQARQSTYEEEVTATEEAIAKYKQKAKLKKDIKEAIQKTGNPANLLYGGS